MSGSMRRARAFVAAALLLVASDTWSASQDECAGWLCITVGFAPPQCAPAKAAMTARLFLLKPPLPPFSACSEDGNSQGFDVELGIAAKVGSGDSARYILGKACSYDDDNRNDGDRDPPGCTGTYRAIAVTQHGVRMGDIMFVHKPSGERRTGPGYGVGGCKLNFDDDCDPLPRR